MSMLTQLALTALLVALLPVISVIVSSDQNKYRKLAWVAVFLTFDLIMFGAFTRLTDSGLGCPDWPGCYGHANPLQARVHIDEAVLQMPDGPVTLHKAWIEMIHRYVASAVGVLTIILVIMGWLLYRRQRQAQQPGGVRRLAVADVGGQGSEESVTLLHGSRWWPVMALVCICIQGVFGAWTVTMKLQPIIVTIHLLLALLLLALLIWIAASETPHQFVDGAARRFARPAVLCLGLLVLQIALGGWTSTNYAALACQEFPLCQGVWLPVMDFAHGFTLWRKLGMTASGDYLPFEALTAIHWVHRTFAMVVAVAVCWLGFRISRFRGVSRLGYWLISAVVLQFCTGLATIFFNWPLAIAVLHTGGSSLLLGLLVMVNYRLRMLPGTVAGADAAIAAAEKSMTTTSSRPSHHHSSP